MKCKTRAFFPIIIKVCNHSSRYFIMNNIEAILRTGGKIIDNVIFLFLKIIIVVFLRIQLKFVNIWVQMKITEIFHTIINSKSYILLILSLLYVVNKIVYVQILEVQEYVNFWIQLFIQWKIKCKAWLTLV